MGGEDPGDAVGNGGGEGQLHPRRLEMAVLRLVGGLVAFCGAAVLAGWLVKAGWLAGLFPPGAVMKANTALCFLINGGAMLLLGVRGRPARFCNALARTAAGGAALLALLSLLEDSLTLDLRIDRFLSVDSHTTAADHPGRMGVNSAICTLLSDASIWMVGRRRGAKRRRGCAALAWLGAFVVAVALAALVAHLQLGLVGYRWLGRIGMAFPTALVFVAQGATFVWLAARRAGFRWALGRALTVEFAVGLVLLALAALLVHGSATTLRNVVADIRVAEATLHQAATLRSAVAALGAAGNGDPSSADSERRKSWAGQGDVLPPALAAAIEQLAACTDPNPAQAHLLQRIHSALGRWTAAERAALALRDPVGLSSAAPSNSAVETQSLLRESLEPLGEIELQARHELGSAEKTIRTELERTFGLLPPAALVAMLLFSSGMVRLSYEMNSREGDLLKRHAAEREIRSLNASLEQRVRDRTEKLEAAIRELDDFSYSVSHDLRAPLRAIDGFSKMLVEDHAAQLPAEAVRKLKVISAEACRMNRLIDDLLAFSRLGRAEVHRERIDMSALARDTFDQLLELDSERRKIDFSVRPLPPALGTPSLIRQVWANLIGNALKFTRGREPTRIRIDAAHASDGSTVYSIEDNGVGFDMRHADKLFGVFQRLHSEQEIPGTSRPASLGRVASGPSSGAATAPVPRFEGTGVGLALVQRIIARHGGRVWAEARPGQGATFFFSLPNPEL